MRSFFSTAALVFTGNLMFYRCGNSNACTTLETVKRYEDAYKHTSLVLAVRCTCGELPATIAQVILYGGARLYGEHSVVQLYA